MRAKFINIVYIINMIFYILTVILFATIIFGFFAEIFLGAVQVVSSLILLIFWNQYSKKEKKKLGIYWGVVAVYFLLWLVNWNFLPRDLVFIAGVGVIPMGIGFYFLMLLRELKVPKQVDLIQKLGYESV